ncbi:hypothetical protein F5887DRAFT_529882 [Amanita rubescens]|nr:hypothetical protein F5887DRAFT_529882 [Amanita rubescens]
MRKHGSRIPTYYLCHVKSRPWLSYALVELEGVVWTIFRDKVTDSSWFRSATVAPNVPHRSKVMSTRSPEALRLTEAMTKTHWRNGKAARNFINRPGARARFFAAVDDACKIQSRTPESCYLIAFACSAGIRIIIDQDLLKLCDPDRRYIMNESTRLSFVFTGNVESEGGCPTSIEATSRGNHW